MTKKTTEKWPIRVWCVCYKSTDYPGGWVPYSGNTHYYKQDAVAYSGEHPNSKVKAFYLSPRPSGNK